MTRKAEIKRFGEPSVYDLGTRHVELGETTYVDQTLNMAMLGDTVELVFSIRLSVTGVPIGIPLNVTDTICHIQLATCRGMIKAIIPGEFLELNYLRFSNSHTNLDTAPQKPSYEAQISIPGLSLPRQYGPWQLTVFYNPYSHIRNMGYIEGATVYNHIQGYYGNANGYISRYLNQCLPLSHGINMIQTTSVPQNVPIEELMMQRLSNSQNIEQILLQTNGQIIEPNTSGALLQARAAQRFAGKLPEHTLVLLAHRAFVLNSSSEFQLCTNKDEPDASFLWYWKEGVEKIPKMKTSKKKRTK